MLQKSSARKGFAPKIGGFREIIGMDSMRKLLCYNNFRKGVFFEKSFFARRLCRRLYSRMAMSGCCALINDIDVFSLLG